MASLGPAGGRHRPRDQHALSAIGAAVFNLADDLRALTRPGARCSLDEGLPGRARRSRSSASSSRRCALDPGAPAPSTAEIRAAQPRRSRPSSAARGLRNPRELALTFTRLGFARRAGGAGRARAPLAAGLPQLPGERGPPGRSPCRRRPALRSRTITPPGEGAQGLLAPRPGGDGGGRRPRRASRPRSPSCAARSSYGVAVERRYGDLPPVICNSHELNQVWTNLIHNAAAGHERAWAGSPSRPGARTPRRRAHHRQRARHPRGASAAASSTRSSPPRTRARAPGLGLGISQQIVERHQGEIRVESEPGRTSFEVLLPSAAARAGGGRVSPPTTSSASTTSRRC